MSEGITLKEGSGGEEMIKLLEDSILPYLEGEREGVELGLKELDDGAAIELDQDKHLVITTDSHAVKPRFFSGGDLGKLAVSGTINDLAMMGADPKALSSGLVIEEGFEKEELAEISKSMGSTAEEAGAPIITGDTKVVGEGETDGIMINTSGIGISNRLISDSGLKAGDKIITTGTIGDHGMTIISEREGFDSPIESDIAPLNGLIENILEVGGITAMKDPTRGGLSEALNEMASKSEVGVLIEKEKIPIKPEVQGASEMLGIDPLMIANEGKAVLGVKESKAPEILEAIKQLELGKNAEIIGECTEENTGRVILETEVGGKRILRSPKGKPIPRIC